MNSIVITLLIGSIAGEVPFGVAAQTVNAAGIARTSAAGSIGGHVTDAHSKPIDSYSVIVFPTDRTKWSPDFRSVMMVRPAQDGGFEVVGLAPGEYWVAAVDAIPTNQPLSEWGKPEVLERLSRHTCHARAAGAITDSAANPEVNGGDEGAEFFHTEERGKRTAVDGWAYLWDSDP